MAREVEMDTSYQLVVEIARRMRATLRGVESRCSRTRGPVFLKNLEVPQLGVEVSLGGVSLADPHI